MRFAIPKSYVFGALLILAISSHAQTLFLSKTNENVKFRIKNFGLTVDGSFNDIIGKIVWSEANLGNSSFDVSINTSSISTGIAIRDKHLLKDEYFDVEKFPVIRFKSTKISSSTQTPGVFQVEGELSIKGTVKTISFPFSLTGEANTYSFIGQFALNRRDYNIGGRSLSLSDNVIIFLNVQAMKSQTDN